MDGKRFLHSIRLKNLLSYGSEGMDLELQPLNVLIGPNASGKSNLIEAISLLAAAPRDLLAPIREGGGVESWLWKGASSAHVRAELEAVLEYPSLRYRLELSSDRARPQIVDEVVEKEADPEPAPYVYYAFRRGQPSLKVRLATQGGVLLEERTELRLTQKDIDYDRSILSQRNDAALYPEVAHIATQFGRIALFRDWHFGLQNVIRQPQRTDLPSDFLLESASNLALVLNDLLNRADIKRVLLDKLRLFYERIGDLATRVQGGRIEIFLHEEGLTDPIPAARLSDGTLRYLCLLAILCHPEPPPLLCIEEPELGLHPDILPVIGELLIDASARTQIIVATHSESLISSLNDVPEAVVICEREKDGTSFRRLNRTQLGSWLERHTLGDLWRMGEIGGNRW